MRKTSFRPRTLVFLIAFLIMLLIPIVYRNTAEPSAQTNKTSVFSSNMPYFLTSFDDHLILVDPEGKTIKISDIDPRTLPPYDQSALAAGIPIKDFSVLEEILQDFS